jgi:alpha(1,3/1,4) fucosyltransferase
MRRVWFTEEMTATPFQVGPRRNNLRHPDLQVVDGPDQADVICARRLGEVIPHAGTGRALIVWTHEPVYCPVNELTVTDQMTGATVHLSTTFNGEVYLTPLEFFPFRPIDRAAILGGLDARPRFAAILATHRLKFDRYIGADNVDITEYRQRLALHLKTVHDACTIFGRNWPPEAGVTEESRGAGWQNRKMDALADYRFNICCENTLWPNYVTEKLWQCIQSGAVPVYCRRGSGIEDHLRAEAVIDPRDFASFDALYAHMAGLTAADRRAMVLAALDDYDRINATWRLADVRQAVVDRFVARLHEIS